MEAPGAQRRGKERGTEGTSLEEREPGDAVPLPEQRRELGSGCARELPWKWRGSLSKSPEAPSSAAPRQARRGGGGKKRRRGAGTGAAPGCRRFLSWGCCSLREKGNNSRRLAGEKELSGASEGASQAVVSAGEVDGVRGSSGGAGCLPAAAPPQLVSSLFLPAAELVALLCLPLPVFALQAKAFACVEEDDDDDTVAWMILCNLHLLDLQKAIIIVKCLH
uniref:uncharacterized protein LOC114583965 n=1 Tax=Podarcis muralis TaxID=64176 RepID=UPI00109FB222|nr:uncharacterized protein LOC114583965 [Podarcis muralis]